MWFPSQLVIALGFTLGLGVLIGWVFSTISSGFFK